MAIKVYNTKTGRDQFIHPDLMKDKVYMQSHGLIVRTAVEPFKVTNLQATVEDLFEKTPPASATTPKPKSAK